MLAPLLEGARDWIVPPGQAAHLRQTHFAARAAERGVRSIPGHLLLWVVQEAHRRGRTDLVAPVWPICDESTLYRIRLPEGVFYPVFRGDVAVTIYGAREKRNLCRARRGRKKHHGRRLKPAVAR